MYLCEVSEQNSLFKVRIGDAVECKGRRYEDSYMHEDDATCQGFKSLNLRRHLFEAHFALINLRRMYVRMYVPVRDAQLDTASSYKLL